VSDIFKDCDIRGRYGETLFDHHAKILGKAISQLVGPKPVIVGGDARPSTPTLKGYLIEGLVDSGSHVVDIGTVSTPMFYFARDHLGILPGVMVTASHNPGEDNGFKVILGTLPISLDEMNRLRQLMHRPPPPVTQGRGDVKTADVVEAYLAFIKQHTPSLSGLKVIVDCGNGMASIACHEIWQGTNAKVKYLFDDLDGSFPNHLPNPAVEGNLSILRDHVVQEHADLGIAYDGDADRVAFIDHQGRVLVNDKAIVIFLRRALDSGPATIIYDQKCSRIVPETILSLGGTPIMERSGHTFMKRAFLTHQAAYAGELSGHHFFQSVHGDDALLGSLYMAEILVKSGIPLATMADKIPSYPITPDIRLPMDRSLGQHILEQLKEGLAQEAKLSTLDGVRAEFEDGWGLARLSVTEPAMTLRFEGETESALERIMERFETIAKDLAGRLPRANL